MIKKAKKTAGLIKWSKHERVIALIVVSALAGLLSLGAYNQYVIKLDKERISLVRAAVSSLKSDFEKADGRQGWKDDSYCTVVEPRLFGDEMRYSCTSLYVNSTEVNNQDDIKAIVDRYRQIQAINQNIQFSNAQPGMYPEYTNNKVILQKSDYKKSAQVSIDGFTLRHVKIAKCHVSYELTSGVTQEGVEMMTQIYCVVDTKDAYFEPIRRV